MKPRPPAARTPAPKPAAGRAQEPPDGRQGHPATLRRTGACPLVIGHRGASARVPENTLPAFRAAWEGGAAWVEADTQPTADGVPVILHDEDLDRTTAGTGPIRSSTTAALAAAPVLGLPGERVPELAALLELLTPDRHLLLEIKGEHTQDQVAEVIRVSRAGGRDAQVFLQSFEVQVLRAVRAVEPARPFGLLVERLDPDPVRRCRELGAVAYNPEYREVLERPDLITALRAAGIAVAVWTCDDPDGWHQLTAAGVDAIITNTPQELIDWQAEHGC